MLFTRDDVGKVKWDFRYVVIVSSVKPLVAYAYKVFWLRFANQPFSLDHLVWYGMIWYDMIWGRLDLSLRLTLKGVEEHCVDCCHHIHVEPLLLSSQPARLVKAHTMCRLG